MNTRVPHKSPLARGLTSFVAVVLFVGSLAGLAATGAGDSPRSDVRSGDSATELSQHWAFKPVERPPAPNVADSAWPRNELDRFILARLEREGLRPSSEADRVTLIRRLYLDLIGLPPTIEEVDAFVAEKAPKAHEKLVERLLASPHYGERWGRHWLDAARYADSDGFEKDKSRNVWFYRDYVINAFNRDLPYDQFIIEQLAGDLLPNATQEQIVATGFLRHSMINEEGGIDPEQFRMEAMFDRMDAIGKGILGLTIQCAQCHDHKYDPLKQQDYYRMFAFLNNDHEAQRVVYTPEEKVRAADLMWQMREIESDSQHRTTDWQEQMQRWEVEATRGQPEWTVLAIEHDGENSQRYIPYKDGSVLAQGYAPTKLTAKFHAKIDLSGITAARLELLTDPNLPCGGPGRSFKGTCALTEFSVEAAPANEREKRAKVEIAGGTADFEQPVLPLEPNFFDKTDKKRTTGPIKFALDGDDNTAWGIDAGPGRRNQDRKAVFQFKSPVSHDGGTVLTIHLKQNHGGWNSDDHMNNNLGRFRLSVTTAAEPTAAEPTADPLPKRVRDALAIPRDQRTPAQSAAIFSHWRSTVPELKDANDRIESLWADWPAGSTSLTLMARTDARDTRLLNRGDWLKPTAPVAAGVPAFLHSLPATFEPTRHTFARWLVDCKSPTTARAFVNRIWQAYFGTGLVATPEDFGTQSDPPSHPELLDWLAAEFMTGGVESRELRVESQKERGSNAAAPSALNPQPSTLDLPWSIKHIHRLIVNSATYRQSSRVTPELLARDPNNRLLAHGPRFRVEGEIVRDIALAASGLLNPRIGGRSVMPPAPAYLFQPPASYAPFPWVDETGPEKYRRALYTFRRRSTPYPALQTFDVPNADSACVRRLRSNSPLQALTSLNEPIFVECAQALARKTLADGGRTDADRITYAFRRALARRPNDAESRELLALLQTQFRRIADGWINPHEIATGENKLPADLPAGATPAQLAAYTVVARVLLNLDETITKE